MQIPRIHKRNPGMVFKLKKEEAEIGRSKETHLPASLANWWAPGSVRNVPKEQTNKHRNLQRKTSNTHPWPLALMAKWAHTHTNIQLHAYHTHEYIHRYIRTYFFILQFYFYSHVCVVCGCGSRLPNTSARNQTQIVWKSNTCSYPPNHLSNPREHNS